MIKAFQIAKGNDSLHSIGGLFLIGQALEHSKLAEIFQSTGRSGLQFLDVDILKSQIGILSQGREKFTDISQFRGNQVFIKSLKLKAVPSEESLRQRLNEMPQSHNILLEEANIHLLEIKRMTLIQYQ